jgi:hypothetical protein
MPQVAKYFGIELGSSGKSDGESFARAASDRVLITTRLTDSRPGNTSLITVPEQLLTQSNGRGISCNFIEIKLERAQGPLQ